MSDIVQVESAGASGAVIRITPQGSLHDISLVPAILAEFESQLKNGARYFVFDMRHFDDMVPSFIALLFEMTAKARRHGGELEIVNLTPGSRVDIDSFKCDQYLSMGKEEHEVFAQFDHFAKEIPPILPNIESDGRLETIEIPSTVNDIYKVTDRVIKIADKMGFEQGELSKLRIAVYEGCLNAVEHAYHGDSSFHIKVEIEHNSNKLQVTVIDFGEGFQSEGNGDFDVLEAAMNRSRGGMGLHIIKKSMDEVSYENNPLDGNRLIMTKYLNANL